MRTLAQVPPLTKGKRTPLPFHPDSARNLAEIIIRTGSTGVLGVLPPADRAQVTAEVTALQARSRLRVIRGGAA